jgi:diguanylate cyclase (GGDEF)-like protein
VHGRVEASRLADELDMAITTLQHGLCLLDENDAISVANERARRFFRALGVTDLIGRPLQDVVETLRKTGPLPEEEVLRLLDLVSRGESGKVLLSLGTRRHFEVSVSSRQDRSVLLFEDISERVATSERISFMARHDTLTALPNRSHFGDLVSTDLAARPMGRGKIRTASLMIIDIDDFKHVNDTYGHLVGDRLLIEVSARLRQSVPSHAILARLGGDEFVIYRDAVRDTQQAEAEGQRVLDAFRTPFAIEGNMLNVGVSLGIATTTGANDTLDDLMTKADLALYSAKADGKAKTRMFHQQMDVDYHYRQRLKADLQAAIGEGALSLAFQPLLDIETRKVVSCEALARWTHPELGQIPPAVFIPLAEEIGLISEISAWVLKEATLQCAQWHPSVGVAVNISARDFRAIDLPALVDGALASAGLHASRLEIEVTETAVIEERDIARSALAALARRGVGIALDDFGTGYSSLSYLSALPFSKLKIDRSFVADIADEPRSLSLLANVARLGRDLDLIVVAEGVETEAQLETMIRHTAVQQVQGYLFSRPLPQRDIAELIGRLNGTALLKEKRKLG